MGRLIFIMIGKFFATTSVLFCAVSAQGQDFFQGVQTGVFLQSEAEFSDYQCPLPEILDSVKSMEDMITPMKLMAQNMTPDHKPIPILDTLEHFAHQAVVLYSLFTTDYDAGEFCKGLIFAKEVSVILMQVFGEFYKQIFMPTEPGEVNSTLQDLMNPSNFE